MPSGSRTPEVIFIYGLAGSGKTFTGTLLAEVFGYHAHDLDQDWTPAIRNAVTTNMPFTDEMRDEYFSVICRRIGELQALHPRLIVMQGAYKRRHREMVKNAHPSIIFLEVRATDENRIARLQKRGDKITPEYAAVLAKNFEESSKDAVIYNNGAEKEVVEQFLALVGSETTRLFD